MILSSASLFRISPSISISNTFGLKPEFLTNSACSLIIFLVVDVIEDVDNPPGFGAFWGEVNSAIHLGFGVKGLVTNGVIRDLDQWANGFAALAGSVGPSHAYTQIIEYSTDVNIYGMVAQDKDIIHFDKHGAVIIPSKVVKDIPYIIEKQSQKESIILQAARAPGFNYDEFIKAAKESEEIH